jgi:hypothetical protein
MARDPTVNPYIVHALQNRINEEQKRPPQMNMDRLLNYGKERMKELNIQEEEERVKPYQRSPTHPVPVRSRDTADIGDDFNIDDFV